MRQVQCPIGVVHKQDSEEQGGQCFAPQKPPKPKLQRERSEPETSDQKESIKFQHFGGVEFSQFSMQNKGEGAQFACQAMPQF